MRKKFTMLLASLLACVGMTQAQVYEKISHDGWVVTAFNETPQQSNGTEGGVAYIKDDNGSTFYHSDWKSSYDDGTQGKKKGEEGCQGFLIDLGDTYSFDKITYAGRSDFDGWGSPNVSGWAEVVNVYVYETLPTDFPENLASLNLAEKNALCANEELLGEPAFENAESPWPVNNHEARTGEFATQQKGRYIFFIQREGKDAWLTCSQFDVWAKNENSVNVTFNYYDGDTKIAEQVKAFATGTTINIGDVPTMDFYADYAFKSEGDITAVEDASYDISCRADFPFELSTVDANGKVDGVWYKLTQTGDGANNKIAYTYGGEGNDPHRVNFVDNNENAKAYWAFVKVDGTAYRFRIYNLGRPGVPMAAVRNTGYQHFNQGRYYIDNRANSVTEFIISKNETGFNIQIPFEYTDNWYAGSGNHIEPKPQFGIWSTQDNASIARGGSRLSVEEVAVSDLLKAQSDVKFAWRNVALGEGFPNFTTTYNETSIASFEALDAVIDAATTVDDVNTIAAELEENASKYRIRMYNAGRNAERGKKFYVSGSKVVENGNEDSEFWYDIKRNLQQVTTGQYLVHSTTIASQNDAYSLTSTQSEASVFTFTTTTVVEGAWSVYDGFGYMCDWGNTNNVFSHNKPSDKWATWMVEDVVRETLLATFEELCLAAIGYANGVDLGSYTHKDYNDPTELGAEIERIKSIVDADATIAEIESAIQQIENLIDGFNIELPTKGFYYFVNYDFDDNGQYLSDDRLNDSKTQRVLTTGEPTAKNIFYYDGQALMGYASGFGFEYGICNTQTPEKMNHFEFGMAYDFGMYTVKSSNGTSENGWADRYWKNKGNNELDYVEAVDAANASGWELVKVTSLPVTVGARLHATFFAPVAVAIPDGVKAYTGLVNGEWLTLTEVKDVIPAEIAVVLIAEEADTYEFTIVESEAAVVESHLRGTIPTIVNGKKDAEDKYYTLQSHGDNGVAFRPYTGANFGGFKAYLEIPAGDMNAAALRIRFADEEDATGIESVATNEELVIFDLAGRRVQKMEKGIYIVNGRKVIK